LPFSRTGPCLRCTSVLKPDRMLNLSIPLSKPDRHAVASRRRSPSLPRHRYPVIRHRSRHWISSQHSPGTIELLQVFEQIVTPSNRDRRVGRCLSDIGLMHTTSTANRESSTSTAKTAPSRNFSSIALIAALYIPTMGQLVAESVATLSVRFATWNLEGFLIPTLYRTNLRPRTS
jgi:hypothetical protein